MMNSPGFEERIQKKKNNYFERQNFEMRAMEKRVKQTPAETIQYWQSALITKSWR